MFYAWIQFPSSLQRRGERQIWRFLLSPEIFSHITTWYWQTLFSKGKLIIFNKKTVEEYQPDVVGLSAMTFQFNTAWRIAEFIKSVHRDIKIAIGGYHATLMYEEIASNDDGKPFDYIIRGEGEKTFGDMLDAIEGKQKWEDISGLSYRRNGGFYTIHQAPLENLETLQLPRRNARM